MCCFAVSQLLMLGKSIISRTSTTDDGDAGESRVNIDWPEDVVSKAKIIRINAQTMIGYLEAVSYSFITGWIPSTSITDTASFAYIRMTKVISFLFWHFDACFRHI